MSCNNVNNEFGFFRSYSKICKSCKQSNVCNRLAALDFVKTCNINYNPDLLVCKECKHRKLCSLYHLKNHVSHEEVIN